MQSARLYRIPGGDYELSTLDVRHAVLAAKLVEQGLSIDREARLERSGRIVDAAVNDTAIVGTGVHAWPGVAFEDAHRVAPPGEGPCAGKPAQASADDKYINLLHEMTER